MTTCPQCGLETDEPEGSCLCPIYHTRTTCPIYMDGQTKEEIMDRQNTSQDDENLRVTVYDGKYTVIQKKDGAVRSLRYGEEWRNCIGDGLVLALAQEVQQLRADIAEHQKNLDARVAINDVTLRVLANPCVQKLKKDEPFFVLRAQDATAPDVINEWLIENRNGPLTTEKREETLKIMEAMRAWPNRRAPT